MGGTWLPDPSYGSSNEITEPPIHIIDSDSDDTEIVESDHATTAYYEYHLLTDGEHLPDSDGIPQPDNNLEEDNDLTTNDAVDNSTTAECSVTLSEEKIDITPRDIIVDCDQVRAAMAQVTLPPSATPSWAASIPDSEWHTFLQNRMRSLQNDDHKSSCQLLLTVQKLVEKYRFLINSPENSSIESKYKNSISSKSNSMDQPSCSLSPRNKSRRKKTNEQIEYSDVSQSSKNPDLDLSMLNESFTRNVQNSTACSPFSNKYSMHSYERDGEKSLPSELTIFTKKCSNSEENHQLSPTFKVIHPKPFNNHILRITNQSCPIHSKAESNDDAYILKVFQENELVSNSTRSIFEIVGQAGVFGCSDNIIMGAHSPSNMKEIAIIRKGQPRIKRSLTDSATNNQDVLGESSSKWFRYATIISSIIIVVACSAIFWKFKKPKAPEDNIVILFFKNLFRYMNSFFKT